MEIAADSQQWEMLERLIAGGAKFPRADMTRAFLLAAGDGQFFAVEYFLEHGVPVNFADYMGNTALSFAVRRGHADVVNLLLEKGADIQSSTTPQKTSMINGIPVGAVEFLLSRSRDQKRTSDVVCSLMKHGLNPDTRLASGETLLFKAVQFHNLTLVKELLTKGATLEARNKAGHTVAEFIDHEFDDTIKKLVFQWAEKSHSKGAVEGTTSNP